MSMINLITVFLRSFLIQASWNFERMQNLGFFYSISPALRVIHIKPEDLKEAEKRHLEYFNTNPMMSPAILGASIKLEEEGASGDDIRNLKKGLMGSYGALGDSFFWGGLRPVAALSGVTVALSGMLWAPIIFLLVFNIPHFFIRLYSFIMGYREGTGIVSAIKKLDLPGWGWRLKAACIFLAGYLLFALPYQKMPFASGAGMLFIVPSIPIYYLFMDAGVRVETLAVFTIILSVTVGLIL